MIQTGIHNTELMPPGALANILGPKLKKGVREKLTPAAAFTKYQNNPVGFAKDIHNITFTDDVSKMAESVRDNVITLARSSTGTGKSHGASVIIDWFYKSFPDSRVYTIANPYENQKILWSEIMSLADNKPALFKNDRITTMHIERSSKDFITALTVPTVGTEENKEGKFSGKHHRHMLFVVDEGDTVPDFVYRGVEGCMSGGLIVRLLILFNPRYESGVPYRYERDKTANIIHLSAFDHPNVLTGEQVIPGAVDREKTVRRINEWCRPLLPGEKGSDTFNLPGFLEGAIGLNQNRVPYPPLKPGAYEIMVPAFSYMVLGRYPAQSFSQLISKDWTAKARARWDLYVAEYGEVPPVGVEGIAGLDVADDGEDKNIFTKRYGGFVAKQVSWSGMDLVQTEERAASEYRHRNLLLLNVESIGLGAGVAPHLRAMGVNAFKIKVSESPTKTSDFGDFNKLRDQLLWEAREWLRTDPGAMLPPCELLLEELHLPKFEIKNGKVCVSSTDVLKEDLKRSPDHLMSFIQTFAEKEEVAEKTNLEACFV